MWFPLEHHRFISGVAFVYQLGVVSSINSAPDFADFDLSGVEPRD
jgi:hypothetical protein